MIDPKDKYSCMNEKERRSADSKRMARIISDLVTACDSLMAEVTGHGVTDWAKVNDALIAGRPFHVKD